MPSGKNVTRSFIGKLMLLLCGFLGINVAAQAQTDNLMIVKYVDWDSGSGVAVVIWNPTTNPINLANYELRIYGNGSNTPTTTSQLAGSLAPCGTILVGNTEYATSDCPGTVSASNFFAFGPGVNGNDIVVLATTGGQIVDAIGRIGYDPGNNNSQKVNNVNNALYQHTLERTPGNLVRYSLTTGQYNPNATNTATIWPNNKTTNVTGWTVSSSNCLTNAWASTTPTVDAGFPASTLCRDQLIPLNGMATSHNVRVQWSGGKGTFANPNNIITTYRPSPQDHYRIKLTLTAFNGCHQVSDDVIVFNGDSTATFDSFTYTPKNPKVGDTITFTLNNPNPGNMLGARFDFGDGSAPEFKFIWAKHAYKNAGTYDVKVMNVVCPADTLTARIVIPEEKPVEVFIPNIFSPNNDGKNDVYNLQLPATSAFELRVFNRWGKLVFESKDVKNAWDGKNTADGVYYLYLKATLTSGEIIERKLPVTIVR